MKPRKTSPKSPLWSTQIASSESAERKIGVAATAEGSTRTCDSRKSLVRVGGVAGATSVSRWCDNGESLVQLRKVAGATATSRRCNFGAAQGADEKSSRKSAHIGKVDVNACSSSNTKPESRK